MIQEIILKKYILNKSRKQTLIILFKFDSNTFCFLFNLSFSIQNWTNVKSVTLTQTKAFQWHTFDMSNSNGTQFEHDCDQQSWETVPQSGFIFPQKIRNSFYAMLDYFVCSFMDQNNVKTKSEIFMYFKIFFFQFQCKVYRFLNNSNQFVFKILIASIKPLFWQITNQGQKGTPTKR